MEIDKEKYLLYANLPVFNNNLHRAKSIVSNALSQMSNPYVAFSTGKDSTVLLDLVREFEPEVPAVYFDAQAALPESENLLRKLKKSGVNIIRFPTQEPIIETISKHGLDNPDLEKITMRTTVYEPVKRLINKYSFDGFFMGLRADESPQRRLMLASHGLLFERKTDNLVECCPLGWWSALDIWTYIFTFDLDYNLAYEKHPIKDREEMRISYWCGSTNKTTGRWVMIKKEYPDLWQKFVEKVPEAKRFV